MSLLAKVSGQTAHTLHVVDNADAKRVKLLNVRLQVRRRAGEQNPEGEGKKEKRIGKLQRGRGKRRVNTEFR